MSDQQKTAAKKSIEDFLGLTEEEITKRMNEVKIKIRTYPGTEYLKVRLKLYDVQPWPFITYLAYYGPDKLKDDLDDYRCYDGNENVEAILEQLREKYILWKVFEDIDSKNKKH